MRTLILFIILFCISMHAHSQTMIVIRDSRDMTDKSFPDLIITKNEVQVDLGQLNIVVCEKTYNCLVEYINYNYKGLNKAYSGFVIFNQNRKIYIQEDKLNTFKSIAKMVGENKCKEDSFLIEQMVNISKLQY